MATRDELRSAILSSANMKRKSVKLKFFGAEIELLQPTAGDIMRYMDDSTKSLNIANVLLDYAYVPGTEEKVFEEGDLENIKQLPFNEDMQALVKAIEQFTNIMVGEAEKN